MIQGVFFRRKSRRLAEIEVDGQIFEAYISNGIDMSFLKSGIACYLVSA
jgi:DNA-binding sugar fermentation-stimulating protein